MVGVNNYDICGDEDTGIVIVCVIIVFFVMMTVFVFSMMTMMMLMGLKPYSSPRSLQPCQRLWTLFQQQVPEHYLCNLF